MKIGGLQKLTLLDYPDKVACIVFTEGCDLRCPFCHNAPLVSRVGEYPPSSEEEVFALLAKRKGLLDGVVITGGEPLLQPDLGEFISRIREMGFAVKLDTNGTHPDRLEELLPALDYVAMDIKNSPEKYPLTTGRADPGIENVKRSVELLKAGKTDHEFRTTVVKPLFEAEDFERIGKWLAGESKYYLQKFKDSGDLVEGEGLSAYSDEEMRNFLEIVKKYVPAAVIRG